MRGVAERSKAGGSPNTLVPTELPQSPPKGGDSPLLKAGAERVRWIVYHSTLKEVLI